MTIRTRSPRPVECDCGYSHTHGTRRMYVAHKCGCFPCRVAHSVSVVEWRNGGTTAEGRYIDSAGTRRRIEGLSALGWNHVQVAELLNCTKENVSYLRTAARVHVASAGRVASAAALLTRRLPPTGWLADRTRREAHARGWVSLFAWDDDIDDPAARPHVATGEPATVDDVAVSRAMRGEPVNLTRAERDEAARRLNESGHSAADIAARLGTTERTITRKRRADREAAA